MDHCFITTSITWIITTRRLTLGESESSVDSEPNISIRWSDRTVGVGVTAPLTQPEVGADGRCTRQQVARDYSSRRQQANVAQVGDEYNWLHLRADDHLQYMCEGVYVYNSTSEQLNKESSIAPCDRAGMIHLTNTGTVTRARTNHVTRIGGTHFKYTHGDNIQNICTHCDNICTHCNNIRTNCDRICTRCDNIMRSLWEHLHPQWQHPQLPQQ